MTININSSPVLKNETIKRFHSCLLVLLLFAALTIYSNSFALNASGNFNQDLFDIKLSSEVKEALDNGISLTFDYQLQEEKQLWFISMPENKKKYSFILTHHSLSNRYLVNYIGSTIPKNFDSAETAVSFIKEQSIKLLNLYGNENGNTVFRLSLNKFKLLGPMRLNAFTAKQWNIDSGWISWSSEN